MRAITAPALSPLIFTPEREKLGLRVYRGQGRAGQGRAVQGRAGQGRAGQGTEGQGRARKG